MKLQRIVAPIALGAFVFALLASPVSAQGPWSTAAFQSWRQGVTASGRMGVPRLATAALPTCNASNLGAIFLDTTTSTLKVCDGTGYDEMGGAAFIDDSALVFGTGSDSDIEWDTAQTPDAWAFGVGTDSRILWIREKGDTADYALAQQTNPLLAVHSAADTAGQWVGLQHDGANGVLRTGTRLFTINTLDQNLVLVQNNGNPTGLTIANQSFLTWTNNTDATAGTKDLHLSREAAAILQLGSDVNGAAVAQALKAHDGITGTDIAGANLTISGGRGTGTGAAGNLLLQAAPSLATGTTAHTLTDRDLIVAKAKTLTDNSATTFLRVNIAADTSVIVHVFYQVDAENASDQQTIGGMAVVPIVNDAGAESCGTIVEAGEANHVSTGTITSTITCTGAGTGTIDLALTSDTSLNVSPLLTYRVFVASSAGATVTTQ